MFKRIHILTILATVAAFTSAFVSSGSPDAASENDAPA